MIPQYLDMWSVREASRISGEPEGMKDPDVGPRLRRTPRHVGESLDYQRDVGGQRNAPHAARGRDEGEEASGER